MYSGNTAALFLVFNASQLSHASGFSRSRHCSDHLDPERKNGSRVDAFLTDRPIRCDLMTVSTLHSLSPGGTTIYAVHYIYIHTICTIYTYVCVRVCRSSMPSSSRVHNPRLNGCCWIRPKPVFLASVSTRSEESSEETLTLTQTRLLFSLFSFSGSAVNVEVLGVVFREAGHS